MSSKDNIKQKLAILGLGLAAGAGLYKLSQSLSAKNSDRKPIEFEKEEENKIAISERDQLID